MSLLTLGARELRAVVRQKNMEIWNLHMQMNRLAERITILEIVHNELCDHVRGLELKLSERPAAS